MAVKKVIGIVLSFILFISFTGTIVKAEETNSLSVLDAIQQFQRAW